MPSIVTLRSGAEFDLLDSFDSLCARIDQALESELPHATVSCEIAGDSRADRIAIRADHIVTVRERHTRPRL